MSVDDRLAAAEAAIAALQTEVARLTDAEAIRVLQRTYAYCMDKGLYDEVCDLFAEDGELRFMGGVWQGRESVRRLYCGRLRKLFTGGVNGPAYGMMVEHWPSQDVIHVAPGGLTAHGRWRCTLMGAIHDTKPDKPEHLPRQWWEHGIYENDYVKRDGVWQIKTLGYNLFTQADYETGWAAAAPLPSPFFTKTWPEDPGGPDLIEAAPFPSWPETDVVPFHYVHPVTGKPIVPERRG
jgi:carotenoid cleavage dioxygenase